MILTEYFQVSNLYEKNHINAYKRVQKQFILLLLATDLKVFFNYL